MASVETSAINPVFTVGVASPALTGVYLFSIADQLGTTAPNNLMTLLNPVGSGRNIIVAGFFISSYSVGAATSTEPLRGHRITAASGGTLANNATDVVKFNTASRDPIPEVRFGNPTATPGAAIFNSPPPIGTGAGTAFVHSVEAPPGAGPFLCRPGEGVVVRTASGDIDQHFNLTIAWTETNA